ncbi:MAG TPA: Maf and M48 domain-containing protein [Candidatus Margulisiibacteriota bacterium]|nr:Maf and M48 domain-containing protein [Candidatus Margulisiibacteriota bacterium]
MKPIYLASNSRARRELLKKSGLKFKVFPSRVKEKRSIGHLSYAGLVKKNALDKALEASGRIKRGIVIAADTIVVQDKKIFGKPADLKGAKSMLKRISRKPQWLYTGVAIIDKEKRKALLSYEKTKVYMDSLTDSEIDDYFRKVSPLDKAGSFDIQGKGAFFIRRIEGCFYNVVGLPLRTLYRMLKKTGVKFLCLYLLFFPVLLALSGCSTEYNVVTGEQETYYYSTDKEVQMGKAIAKEVEKEYKFADDPLLKERVERVGKRIAAVSDRKEINYSFNVLDDEEVNAVSLPGGYVYVNKGLLDKIESDDELAGVLAHEVGHIVARHSIKKLQGYQGYSLLKLLAIVAPVSGEVGAAADTAFTELLLGYGREDELLADKLGTRYAKLAGYDPHGMLKFLEKLQDIDRRKPLEPKSYFKTHPYVPDRIRVVKEELGESMAFQDYINIEQEEHK